MPLLLSLSAKYLFLLQNRGKQDHEPDNEVKNDIGPNCVWRGDGILLITELESVYYSFR
jgi:hypothetical protein